MSFNAQEGYYTALTNELSITNVDNIEVNTLQVNTEIDISGADVIGLQTGDNISFTNNAIVLDEDITIDTYVAETGASDTLKLGTTREDNVVASGADLHIQSTTNSVIFLEADTDNIVETDKIAFAFTIDGNRQMYTMQTGSNNALDFASYNYSGDPGAISFSTGGIIPNPQFFPNTGQIPEILTPAQVRVTINQNGLNSIYIHTNYLRPVSGSVLNIGAVGGTIVTIDNGVVGNIVSINGYNVDDYFDQVDTNTTAISTNATAITTNASEIDALEDIISPEGLEFKGSVSIFNKFNWEYDDATPSIQSKFTYFNGISQVTTTVCNLDPYNGLSIDNIQELNSNQGVTIEGVLLKDGEVDGVDIASLEGDVIGNYNAIVALTNEVDDNTVDIVTLTGNVNTNTADITSLEALVDQNVKVGSNPVFGNVEVDSMIVGAAKVDTAVGTGIDLQLQSTNNVVLMLEADTNNAGEDENPTIVLSQDGTIVYSTMGIRELGNATHISTYSASGTGNNEIVFATGGVMTRSVGELATISSEAVDRMTINADGVVEISESLKVDTIDELTSANGVVIENVTIKDSQVVVDSYDGVVVPYGTYTPTITEASNIDSQSFTSMRYQQFGDVVHFQGGFDINLTSAASPGVLRVTVPVASTFTAISDASGYGSSDYADNSYRASIVASPAYDMLVFVVDSDASTTSFAYHGTYLIR